MIYSCALALNLLSSDVVLEQRIFAALSIFEINEPLGKLARFGKAYVASRFIHKGMSSTAEGLLLRGLRLRAFYGSMGFTAVYDFLTISTVESTVTDVELWYPDGLLFLQDLFPQKTGRERKIESRIDTIRRPVAFRVVNLPATVREDRWYECTVIATNVSPDEVLKKPKDYSFITLKINGSSAVVRTNERGTLKPGETLTQTIRFRVTDTFVLTDPVRLEWYFFSNRLDD
jgi:hypothetical protein